MIWQDYLAKNNDMDTFWLLSWHLTDGRLTEMNGMACLKVKQT